MQNPRDNNIVFIYFKVARTELTAEYPIDIHQSVEEMIVGVKPLILRDFQLPNVEIVDTNNGYDLYAEDGPALVPSNETLYEKYGDLVYNKAFYIRPITDSNDDNNIIPESLESQENLVAESAPVHSSPVRRCVICMTTEPNMLLGPCNHLCVCQDCGSSPTIHNCPVCRVAIRNRTVVYM